MRYKVVAVRDRAVACFGQPQVVPTVGSAIRSFTDLINGPKDGPVSSHPEDFDLFELGEYDDEACTFVNLEVPRQVAIGKDLVRS